MAIEEEKKGGRKKRMQWKMEEKKARRESGGGRGEDEEAYPRSKVNGWQWGDVGDSEKSGGFMVADDN